MIALLLFQWRNRTDLLTLIHRVFPYAVLTVDLSKAASGGSARILFHKVSPGRESNSSKIAVRPEITVALQDPVASGFLARSPMA